MRTAAPGTRRVAASARWPSTRTWPVRHSFWMALCGRPGKCRRNQRSSRMSASSSVTVRVDCVMGVARGCGGRAGRRQGGGIEAVRNSICGRLLPRTDPRTRCAVLISTRSDSPAGVASPAAGENGEITRRPNPDGGTALEQPRARRFYGPISLRQAGRWRWLRRLVALVAATISATRRPGWRPRGRLESPATLRTPSVLAGARLTPSAHAGWKS